MLCINIQFAGSLVQYDDLRVSNQSSDDGDALPLSCCKFLTTFSYVCKDQKDQLDYFKSVYVYSTCNNNECWPKWFTFISCMLLTTCACSFKWIHHLFIIATAYSRNQIFSVDRYWIIPSTEQFLSVLWLDISSYKHTFHTSHQPRSCLLKVYIKLL